MSPNTTWQKLYNNASMEDMREMLPYVHRLINKLEDAKTYYREQEEHHNIFTKKPDTDYNILTEIDTAQKFWRGIIKMITHQKEKDDNV